MRLDCDAVIVGAGPAGSTAAILLARAGWSVALVEKQRFPRRKVCGECLAASNLPLLDALGIGPAFAAAAGADLRQTALLRGERGVSAALPAAAHAQFQWGRALGREVLDTLLLEQARAAGAQVLQPWAVQGLTGAPGDWRCQIRAIGTGDVVTLTAAVAIDAHGSWERFDHRGSGHGRDLLILPVVEPRRARAAADLFAFKANFRNTELAPGELPVLSLDGGYGGMVVAGDGLTTLACCIRRDRLDALRRAAPGMRAGEIVENWLKRGCKGVRTAMHAATREGAWLAAGPLDPGIRLRADDQPFRIGNAAGEAHPIIGEGMSMALQSAWLLCADLLQVTAGAQPRATPDSAWQTAVGRRYAAQWRRQFKPRLRLAALFAHLAMRPATAVPLLALVRIWPGILTLGARLGGKLEHAADPALLRTLNAAAKTPFSVTPALPNPNRI